jgi:hypothetical protein
MLLVTYTKVGVKSSETACLVSNMAIIFYLGIYAL